MLTINYPTVTLSEKYLTSYFKTGFIPLSYCTSITGTSIGKGSMALLPKACVRGEKITGIDIPVLINDSSRKAANTIMIVEQDPLRNYQFYAKRYKKTILSHNAIVGIPNALHCNPVSFYLKLVEELINKGWNVYLTDVYKIYAPGLKGKKGRLTADELTLLEDELDAIRPTKVILFGKEAQRSFSKVTHSSIKPIELPHRSARAVHWYPFITKATDNAKLDYILSKV